MNDNLEKLLPNFGADISYFYSFDIDSPELLPYATLINTQQDNNELLCTRQISQNPYPIRILLS